MNIYNIKHTTNNYFSQNVLKPGGPHIHTAYSFFEPSAKGGTYLVIKC